MTYFLTLNIFCSFFLTIIRLGSYVPILLHHKTSSIPCNTMHWIDVLGKAMADGSILYIILGIQSNKCTQFVHWLIQILRCRNYYFLDKTSWFPKGAFIRLNVAQPPRKEIKIYTNPLHVIFLIKKQQLKDQKEISVFLYMTFIFFFILWKTCRDKWTF